MNGQILHIRQHLGRATSILALSLSSTLALSLAAPAAAQSVGEFRLQPASPAAPKAQGPIDPDSPAIPPPAAQSSPQAAPTATASATPAPAESPRPAPGSTPRGTRPEPVATPAPGPALSSPSRPAATTAAQSPAPANSSAPAPVQAPPETAPTLAAAPPAAPVAPAENVGSGIAWWWLVPAILLAALVGAGAAWLALRRRTPAVPVIQRPRLVAGRDTAPEEPADRESDAVRPPDIRPVPAAVMSRPAPPALTPQVPPPADLPLDLALDPVRFSVTLVNATLQYRLRLANRSGAAIGPISLAADMIAAHASVPEEVQLARDGNGLEPRHELPALGPGEEVELKGELRLPLAQVTPIRQGAAALLVPLVRLRAETARGAFTWALVVGEEPIRPDGPLRPFRLDHGPRIFGSLAQRELAAA